MPEPFRQLVRSKQPPYRGAGRPVARVIRSYDYWEPIRVPDTPVVENRGPELYDAYDRPVRRRIGY